MPDYRYTACQMSGQQVTGVLTATSEAEAVRSLAARRLYAVDVDPVESPAAGSRRWRRRVPARALAVFYSQLADLLRSGVPLLRSLELLQRRTNHHALKAAVGDVRRQVAEGTHLADAMRQHPYAFSDLAVSMVRAGEEGGFLEDVLKRIALFSEQQQEMKSRVIGASAYPLFLLTMGTIIVSAMMVFFVPKFEPIFERMSSRGELPWATTALMGFSSFLQDYGFILLVVLIVTAVVAARYVRTSAGRMLFDRIRLKVYGLGPIARSLAIARFSRILGTLLHNGVPILRALRIAGDATGNRVLSQAVAAAAENVSAGKSLAQPLSASGQFPEEIAEMIAVGEEANNLEQVLVDVADNLERNARRQIELFVRLLEPVMLLIIAGLILFVVVALLLPIFQSSGVLT
jgi:general secretion pathway protein F/type IV pilus assembly protein PilC